MLKITKGLKKKKKGKKGKRKEEELFEEAELEQYRKEQELKKQQQAEAGEEGGENKDGSKGEEWEKFKALTSGVDSILKKTQGDLDRIKSTSYFQRKPTPSEQAASVADHDTKDKNKKDKKWIGFEEGAAKLDEEESEHPDREEKPEAVLASTSETLENSEQFRFEEEEEESEEEEEEDDIFDTSFVDAVASGEVKLAYIPDSPTQEEDEFDPFDTSIVDKVIKEEPADKKKKNLVSLGCAVDVLTGKVDKPTTSAENKPKPSPRRQKPRDLLLGSFDEGGEQESNDNRSGVQESQPEELSKTLLDDDPILGDDIELDLSINLAPIARSVSPAPVITESDKQEESDASAIKSIVNEFDVISNEAAVLNGVEKLTNGQIVDEDEFDEFAQLAAESLTKEVHQVSPLTVQSELIREESSSENRLKPSRPPPPAVKGEDEIEEDDPFDTSFAAEILPGKYELKLIEEEILSKEIPTEKRPAVNIIIPKSGPLRDPLAFDEHNLLDADDEQTNQLLTFKHRDLLGGSTTDLSKISHNPIEPALISDKKDEELSYCDPFDTSVVNDLVAPGKAELKFLEKELLADDVSLNNQVLVENDDEFNPRGEVSPPRRKSVPRPEQLFLGEKRQSIPKVVAFKVGTPKELQDLLSVGNSESSKASKPLTPYYPEVKLLEENKLSCESEVDPFDTSFVSSTPGKLELKLIENELVGEVTTNLSSNIESNKIVVINHNDVGSDFNPRAGEITRVEIQNQPIQEPVVVTQKDKVESVVKRDILTEDVQVDTKLHTPVVPKRIEEELQLKYSDPFDTSIAQCILPGKAELKLLESELIDSNQESTIKRSYTDPEFDPRLTNAEAPKEFQSDSVNDNRTNNLHITDHPISEAIAEKPLTPLSATFTTQEDDIDPFDTSCVGALIPGKVELKLLETELIHN